MLSIIFHVGVIALRFAAESDNNSTGWGVFVPVISTVIVLVGTLLGLWTSRNATAQRLAFERTQWEAAEAERHRQADREADDRRRASEREHEQRERERAAEMQEAVRRECGECMEKVRGLIVQLDDYTNRLLAAHELIGQRERQIAELEQDLREARNHG